MAKLTPYIDMKDVQEKIDKLINCVDDSSEVFEKTLKDMRSRAPGKVADAVRSVYTLKIMSIPINIATKNSPVRTAQWYNGRHIKARSPATAFWYSQIRSTFPSNAVAEIIAPFG